MKTLLFALSTLCLMCYSVNAQTTIALDGVQSMCITGKGKGQDGAINPYTDLEVSYGIVENIGNNIFSVRIESKGEIIDEISVKPKEVKKIKLLRNQVMYFDSKAATSVKVDFKETLG